MSACEHEWTVATPLEVCARCSVVRYGPEHARELETLLDAARVELDENVGVMRVLRRHRTEAEDSLRQAVAGLPKCEIHVKYRDAMGGEETCRHVAMQSQRRPLLARAEFVCRDHAGGRGVTEIVDLPWAGAVRRVAAIDKEEP